MNSANDEENHAIKAVIDELDRDTSLFPKDKIFYCFDKIQDIIDKCGSNISLSSKQKLVVYINQIQKIIDKRGSNISSSSKKTIAKCFNQIKEYINVDSTSIPSSSSESIVYNFDRIKESMNKRRSGISLFLGIMIALLCAFLLSYDFRGTSHDTDPRENQNFSTYYGVIDSKNHFTTTRVDECGPSIIYQPVFPQMILNSDNSASSFMVLAEYGTGKTLLRCEYFKSLSSNDYLKLIILDEKITEYLDRFVSQMDETQMYCKTKNCLDNWSENEFAQLLLSSLVTNFIHTYNTHKHIGHDLPLDEKVNLITIICYYYNGGMDQLEKFVNSFLGKGTWSQYKVDRDNLQQYEHHNSQLFNHLKNDLKKFSILNKNFERLALLLLILQGEGFQNRATTKHLSGEYFRDLVVFCSFIKTYFKKIPVIVIDGIDQNQYFQGNETNRGSFESFCRSSVSPSILSMVMANHFHLSLFYPKIDGVNIEDIIIRKGKFPTHSITWNTKFLINYADYVLEEMNKNAEKTRCKELPDFKTLVNYSKKKNAEIIDKIPTPRALHYFMKELMRQMNGDASNANPPFEATFENVDNAYKESLKSSD